MMSTFFFLPDFIMDEEIPLNQVLEKLLSLKQELKEKESEYHLYLAQSKEGEYILIIVTKEGLIYKTASYENGSFLGLEQGFLNSKVIPNQFSEMVYVGVFTTHEEDIVNLDLLESSSKFENLKNSKGWVTASIAFNKNIGSLTLDEKYEEEKKPSFSNPFSREKFKNTKDIVKRAASILREEEDLESWTLVEESPHIVCEDF